MPIGAPPHHHLNHNLKHWQNKLYTKGQAIEFLDKAFGTGTPSNQGLNYSVKCPFCVAKNGGGQFRASTYSKRKLVIRTDNFLCHCWVCGYKSRNLIDVLSRHRPEWLQEYLKAFVGRGLIQDDLHKSSENPEEPKQLHLPGRFLPFYHIILKPDLLTPFERKAVDYLRTRSGIPKDINAQNETDFYRFLFYWGFGVCDPWADPGYANRVIMPSFDGEGNVNYYVGRALQDNFFPKYKNPSVPREDVVFNELNISWDEPLTIVEGPFDLVKCGYNSTCLLGSDLTTEYLLFAKIIQNNTPVILALDPDVSAKTDKIADNLHSYGIDVKIVDILNGFKDVGEMTKNQFSICVESARVYDRSYSLRTRVANMLGAK